MSLPIEPGMWVECVDDSPHWGLSEKTLMRGALYCVARVDFRGRLADGSLGVGLCLEGRRHRTASGRLASYRPDRFRPIYRPKQSLIEKLSAPISATEEARLIQSAPTEEIEELLAGIERVSSLKAVA